MILRNAALAPDRICDLKFARGLIAQKGTGLQAEPGEACFDAAFRPLLPGLHDHHMHFLAYAASLRSIECGDPALQSRSELAHFLTSQILHHGSGLRAIGYHEGRDALIDRHWLDRISNTLPIRVQHRTGRLWIYNSAALHDLLATDPADFPDGVERNERGELSGRFYHVDDWLRRHNPRVLPDLSLASKTLASYGVTGFTDAGPDNDNATWQLFKQAQRDGQLLQRVLLMGKAELQFSDDDFMQLGACKVYLKESALPDYDPLCTAIKKQHARHRSVAFHCVTAVELHYALAALADCGARSGDRIEHASICDDEALAIIKQLGVTVVSQPNFIAERGDRYRESVAEDEQRFLYRARAFLDNGIAFAGSTDAPFGKANPWLCMQAAVRRQTPSGAVINANETLSNAQARLLFSGEPASPGTAKQHWTPGEPADCCLLNTDWDALQKLETAAPPAVCATWIGGELVYHNVNV